MTISNVLQTLRRTELAVEAAEYTPSHANQVTHLNEALEEARKAVSLLSELLKDLTRKDNAPRYSYSHTKPSGKVTPCAQSFVSMDAASVHAVKNFCLSLDEHEELRGQGYIELRGQRAEKIGFSCLEIYQVQEVSK